MQGSGSSFAVALLAVLPASEAAIGLTQWIVGAWVPPRRLPRLDLEKEVPEEGRTMVVIPTLSPVSKGSGNSWSISRFRPWETWTPDQLRDPRGFLRRSRREHARGRGDPLRSLRRHRRLNLRHGHGGRHPFSLFHRKRLWNPKEDCFMGWERKRGKIEEFNRLLRGGSDTSYTTRLGDLSQLPAVRFVITLDRDTRLFRDAAKELIGILLHPLHRPRFDPELGRVTEGYGILQPRVSVTLSSAMGSLFSRFHAGNTGMDPYTTAVSDCSQDLFGEGSFTGKGIYDVDAFQAALGGRVPGELPSLA